MIFERCFRICRESRKCHVWIKIRNGFEKKKRYLCLTSFKWSWCKSWSKRYHLVCTNLYPKYTKKALLSENDISFLKGRFLQQKASSVFLVFRISNKKWVESSYISNKNFYQTDWLESQRQFNDTFCIPLVIIAKFVIGLEESARAGVNCD